jgi:Flp pilus assembly protein TadG
MKSSKAVSRRGRGTQAGNAVLEGALVLLPLMALGFALLDYPLAIFIQNTLRGAVREGVRYAITQQTGGSGQDASIKQAIETNSMGFLTDADLTSGASSILISYYAPDPNTGVLTLVNGAGSNAQGNICVIAATINRKFMVPVWRSTGLIPFSASSSDMMEGPPGGILPSR